MMQKSSPRLAKSSSLGTISQLALNKIQFTIWLAYRWRLELFNYISSLVDGMLGIILRAKVGILEEHWNYFKRSLFQNNCLMTQSDLIHFLKLSKCNDILQVSFIRKIYFYLPERVRYLILSRGTCKSFHDFFICMSLILRSVPYNHQLIPARGFRKYVYLKSMKALSCERLNMYI